MLQNKTKTLSYRRPQTPISDDRQAIIDEISKQSVYLERAIDNLEHQFEQMDYLRKNYSDIFQSPILMTSLENSLLNAYNLRKCYDSELRKLVAENGWVRSKGLTNSKKIDIKRVFWNVGDQLLDCGTYVTKDVQVNKNYWCW